jgi:hypothetical protein
MAFLLLLLMSNATASPEGGKRRDSPLTFY